MTWAQNELRRIVARDDLHGPLFREDGTTYGIPTCVWSVAVDGVLCVRASSG